MGTEFRNMLQGMDDRQGIQQNGGLDNAEYPPPMTISHPAQISPVAEIAE
jgi:hypothetical protein